MFWVFQIKQIRILLCLPIKSKVTLSSHPSLLFFHPIVQYLANVLYKTYYTVQLIFSKFEYNKTKQIFLQLRQNLKPG